MNKSVFCIVKSETRAEGVLQSLRSQGFSESQISVLFPDTTGLRDAGHEKSTKAPEGATTGAVAGGVTGGVIGLLAGIGTLAIPGLGPFIAAGPIMAALSGAGIGATTGGVLGGLIGLGIPEIEAKVYEGKLRAGNYLISAHCDNSDQVKRAKETFERFDGEDICTTSEAAVPKEK